MEGESEGSAWTGAAREIQRELGSLRAAVGAEWVVLWGPSPFDACAPFVTVLFEDREPGAPSALGMAVPIAGNPWAQEVFASGSAETADAPRDPRQVLTAALVAANHVRSIASAANVRDGLVWASVEAYARGQFTAGSEPVAKLRAAAARLADVVGACPRPSAGRSSEVGTDPATSAALHDLKNALAAQTLLISSFERDVRAVTSGADPARIKVMLESLAVLRDNVAHANDLTRLMSLGALAPDARVAIGAAGAVKLALASVAPELRARITVELALEARESGAVPSAPPLLRALVNLVQNAALAIQRAPGAAVVVRARREGEHAVFEVEDSGPGVAPALLERIFEPGVTTHERPEGHGYGLYSARQSAELLGGTLTLLSVPGRGARFTLRLPRAAAGM